MSFLTILYSIILSPITQIIEISYKLFNQLFKNTGISLIGVSLTITLLCLPLYIVAEGWQETERNIQDRMKSGIGRIKKFFKGDEQYMILSTYYRQNGYHPIMALRSSFGILIQIPFFLAAYHTLSALPELQGKSFLFIRDMGQPDSVFSIGSFSINILPILMTIINCVSGAIYSRGHGFREKAQIYGMAMIFLVVLYNSPAGLVVYWTMNNVFSLVKNIFYKMKNPLKVLYRVYVISIIALILYIIFIYTNGVGFTKKAMAVSALILFIPIPLYLKFINWLIVKPLYSIFANSKLRFSIFIVSAISLVVFTGLVLPSSLISSSTQEFADIEGYTNPTAFLHSSFWMSFGLFIFWPTCIYFLFKSKIQTILSFAFFGLLICGIVNSYLFIGDYGSMDATLKLIDGLSSQSLVLIIVNILVIALILVITAGLIKFNKGKILSSVCLISALSFTVLSIINISKINSDYSEYREIIAKNEDKDSGFTTKYHLSKTQKNVVIFMLDRYENAFIPNVLEDVDGLKEKLNGFVYYPNTVSYNGHTLIASAAVYGGYEYTPFEMNKRDSVTLKEKHNEAVSLLATIFSKNGFESTLSDTSWANYSWIPDLSFVNNIPNTKGISLLGRYSSDFKKECLTSSDSKSSLSHILNRNLFWVSLFRESPMALRPIVYYKGTWWENGIKETSSSFTDWYSALYYLPKITSVDSEKPTFNMITNEATHSSEDISMYDLVATKKNSLPKQSAYPANMASLWAIGKFVDYLKENGIYDNTKIIITSDHGVGIGSVSKEKYKTTEIGGYNKDHFNCVLLVKDFNSTNEFSTNNDFMTNADVPTLALKDVVENPVNPFTNNPINSDLKKDGAIVTIDALFMPGHSKSEYKFTVKDDSWFIVKDNIFVDENWSKLNK